jgi:hypothetical protein
MEEQELPEYNPEQHLVFDTEAEALAAEAEIVACMNLAPGAVTERWDIPREVADGRWVITKPYGSCAEDQEATPEVYP